MVPLIFIITVRVSTMSLMLILNGVLPFTTCDLATVLFHNKIPLGIIIKLVILASTRSVCSAHSSFEKGSQSQRQFLFCTALIIQIINLCFLKYLCSNLKMCIRARVYVFVYVIESKIKLL